MTTGKPIQLAHFISGKTIYASIVKCCSQTLNWLISCWDNFSVDGYGLVLKEVEIGRPKIKLELEAGENITLEKGKDNALKISAEGGGANYIKGDDTNIVFTPVTSGANAGSIKIDVYYS